MDDILEFMRGRMNKEHFNRFLYVFNSGKRIRPQLMKDVCDFLDRDFEPLLAAAGAIEVMHCVSLVHDDIVDKSEERRGGESFYRKYGTNSAVLFGDLFAVMATEILAEQYSKEIYLEFIKTMKNMIDGQIMEISGAVKDLETYFSYIDKKTSSLFAMSVKIPLMYYGIDRDDIVKASRDFGAVFQMINDMTGKKEVGILDFLPPADAALIIKNRLDELKKSDLGPIKKNLESLTF